MPSWSAVWMNRARCGIWYCLLAQADQNRRSRPVSSRTTMTARIPTALLLPGVGLACRRNGLALIADQVVAGVDGVLGRQVGQASGAGDPGGVIASLGANEGAGGVGRRVRAVRVAVQPADTDQPPQWAAQVRRRDADELGEVGGGAAVIAAAGGGVVGVMGHREVDQLGAEGQCPGPFV